ncbi:unnamed protein product [Leuciscus chuanchicus]
MCLAVFVILVLHIENILTNMITSHDSQKQVLEGESVKLTCNYSGVPDILQWYIEYPGSTPKFLLYIYESGLIRDASSEGIAPVSPNEFVSEGKTITLSCNYTGSAATDALHWYRQYPRSRPDFLFLVEERHMGQRVELSHKVFNVQEAVSSHSNLPSLPHLDLGPASSGIANIQDPDQSSLFFIQRLVFHPIPLYVSQRYPKKK